MAYPTVPKSRPCVLRLNPLSRRDLSFSLPTGVFAIIRTWIIRRHGRRKLQGLAERGEEHLLEDIGMTLQDALRAAGKWFWQR